MRDQSIIWVYGLGGLIPFVFGAFGIWIFPESMGLVIANLSLNYAAIILSFLAGLIWAIPILNHELENHPGMLTHLGIILSLLAWATLYMPDNIQAFTLLVSFWVLRKLEHRYADSFYSKSFNELRDLLTRTVIASLISLLVFSLQSG